MKLKILFLLFLGSLQLAVSIARGQTVTGTVTDIVTGDPLPGVNVIIETTVTGTSTDLNGRFILPKPLNGQVIAVSFIGYSTERVTYAGQAILDIKLSQLVKELDQVIVVGYGTVKKSDLTGSVAQVTSKEIEKVTPVNIQSALQGKATGLMVTASSGSPSSEPVIRIRGIGTINNNDPIYVVDGMIVQMNPFDATNISYLNPMDISSIEILKDASAQAIYGSRGANGVILVTTRKGGEGAPKITFTSTIGVNNVGRVPKVLDRDQFMDYITTCYSNGYIRTHNWPGTEVPLEILVNEYETVEHAVTEYNDSIYTDWYDEILRKNVINQNYNLQLYGGTKNSHYLASAGYLFNDGLINNYSYKRYSFRLNTDFKVGNRITLGENLGITSSDRRGYIDYAGAFQNAMVADPLAPVYKPLETLDSLENNDPNFKYNKYAPSLITDGNPALNVELMNVREARLTLLGNMYGEISILKDLKFRSSYGFNLAYSDYSDYSPAYTLSPGNGNALSSLYAENGRTNGWVWENTLTYSKTKKNHSVTGLLGFTSEYTNARIQSASKKETPNNNPEMQTFDAAITQPNVFGGYTITTMISYFARVNYSYRNKYLITATIRRDGSSKFGPDYRWGTFPSFSLGWNISEENFIKNNVNRFITNLKLRAGWGQIGNSSLPSSFAYTSQFSSINQGIWNPGNRYIFGEKVYTGYYLSTIGTPDITWETTEQTNIGIDISIMKNSLSLTADYFIKNTKDMLLQVPAPAYSGYSNATPYANAGSVQNRGFEFMLDYRGKSGNFSYGATVNISTFKNKVTSLGKENKPLIYGQNRTEVGKPIGSFYGLKSTGIFQSDYAVGSYVGPHGDVIQPQAHPGDMRFMNLDFDNSITGYDETWIGNPWPDFTYGLTINLGYKSFDLMIFMQGSYGNDIYTSGVARHMDFVGTRNEFEYIYKDAWRGMGTSDYEPILSKVDENDNFRNSDYFVEDGSYMRLKNIQLGFNLPQSVCEKLRLGNARIWVGGTNLLTWTKYRGIDPEIGSSISETIYAGNDPAFLFPQSEEVLTGITLSF